MSIVKTEAFVLKSFRYKDTSKIVTLFTKDFGKITALVKGSRNYKSRNCGTLESMNYINSIIYLKRNRELQLVSQAEYIKSFSNIINDFEKLKIAFRIIEIINNSLIDGEVNKPVFRLLIESYEKLNLAESNSYFYMLYFQIKLTDILGLSPDFSDLKNDFETFFNRKEFNISTNNLEDIIKSIREKIENTPFPKLDYDVLVRLSKSYEKYLLSHTQGYRAYKSNKVFLELNQ